MPAWAGRRRVRFRDIVRGGGPFPGCSKQGFDNCQKIVIKLYAISQSEHFVGWRQGMNQHNDGESTGNEVDDTVAMPHAAGGFEESGADGEHRDAVPAPPATSQAVPSAPTQPWPSEGTAVHDGPSPRQDEGEATDARDVSQTGDEGAAHTSFPLAPGGFSDDSAGRADDGAADAGDATSFDALLGKDADKTSHEIRDGISIFVTKNGDGDDFDDSSSSDGTNFEISTATMKHGITDPKRKTARHSAAAVSMRSSMSIEGQMDEIAGSQATKSTVERPRMSVLIWCAVLGILSLTAAVGVYIFGVHTNVGQAFDTITWSNFATDFPGSSALARLFDSSYAVVGVAGGCALLGVILAVVRRRYALIVQMAVYAALCITATLTLKRVLPRPVFDVYRPNPANSAPSGHELLLTGGAIVLLFAVPRVWRSVVALLGMLLSTCVGFSLVAGQWHRPADIVMAQLIAVGFALLVLAFTRGTGLDDFSQRKQSAGVQIVAPACITLGVLLCAYAMFGVWQLLPSLDMSPEWGAGIACWTSAAAIAGTACLGFGLLCAVRQLTASPLTDSGLFGTPPKPPREPRKSADES